MTTVSGILAEEDHKAPGKRLAGDDSRRPGKILAEEGHQTPDKALAGDDSAPRQDPCRATRHGPHQGRQ